MENEKILNDSIEYMQSKLDNFYQGFTVEHTFDVLRISKIISKNYVINSKAIELAIIFHDIGRIISDDSNHAIQSWDIAYQFLKDKINNNELDLIKDIILNHGSKNKPLTLEGKIVRDSDILSLINPRILLKFFYHTSKSSKTFDEALKIFSKKIGKNFNELLYFSESKIFYNEKYKNYIENLLRFLREEFKIEETINKPEIITTEVSETIPKITVKIVYPLNKMIKKDLSLKEFLGYKNDFMSFKFLLHKHSTKILKEIPKHTNINWKVKEMVVYPIIDGEYPRAIAYPLIIKLFGCNNYSLYTLIHELIHNNIDQETTIKEGHDDKELYITKVTLKIMKTIFNKLEINDIIKLDSKIKEHKEIWESIGEEQIIE